MTCRMTWLTCRSRAMCGDASYPIARASFDQLNQKWRLWLGHPAFHKQFPGAAIRPGARASSTPSKRILACAKLSSCSAIFPVSTSAVSSAVRSHGKTLSSDHASMRTGCCF